MSRFFSKTKYQNSFNIGFQPIRFAPAVGFEPTDWGAKCTYFILYQLNFKVQKNSKHMAVWVKSIGLERNQMRTSYSQIYIHLIWSTKKWEPLINENIESDIYKIFDMKAKKYNSNIIKVGNTLDHIHVLVKISTRTVISEMVREFKGATSYFINQNGGNLYWQDGYGAVSISLLAVDTVRKYVENQKKKHVAKEIIEQLEIIEANE